MSNIVNDWLLFISFNNSDWLHPSSDLKGTKTSSDIRKLRTKLKQFNYGGCKTKLARYGGV